MTNTELRPALYESLECPAFGGRRLVQHLTARISDVGGLTVHRVLPQRARRTIGAWCFLDHAGPASFSPGEPGMRVGPHPHIGLQTFTWMIAGEVLHRDSLGHVQAIRPGQLNLMTAGRGIAHTEESVPESAQIHAAQLWIALPRAHRHAEPRFDHYPELPQWVEQGVSATLLTGSFGFHQAPTLTFSPLFALDLMSVERRALKLPVRLDFEYGAMVLEGALEVGGQRCVANELAYFGCGLDAVKLEFEPGARVLLLGGEPLGEEIFIWWNLVGHDRAEIATAQREWEEGSARFGEVADFDGPRLVAPPIPWRERS